ncbi:MAG: FAD-dependent thymidylate synthase [Paracoccaceae bacterium]|nr:FAD-dependent thymidylate synthase [Paracoccaceae bacterium]
MSLTDEQKEEIKKQTSVSLPTKRAISLGMEEKLFLAHEVLDHGFIRVIDYMGNDSSIVQAARVSYGEGTKKSRDDRALIRYLMRHWHSTPFEMCELKLHVKLPVFVARQWIRHRTANVNEYSARYSILDKEFYIPEKQNLASQSNTNNQGRGEPIEDKEAQKIIKTLETDSLRCYENYEEMLSDKGQKGLARELARMNLPMNIYTQWYWKTDLHNLFNFLRLRNDEHAQFEIREYAEKICQITKSWVPLAYEAFEEYQLHSQQLSASGLSSLKRILDGENVTQETSEMSKREWVDFCKIIGKKSEI